MKQNAKSDEPLTLNTVSVKVNKEEETFIEKEIIKGLIIMKLQNITVFFKIIAVIMLGIYIAYHIKIALN